MERYIARSDRKTVLTVDVRLGFVKVIHPVLIPNHDRDYVTALRGYIDERSEFLITTLSVSDWTRL